MQLIARAHLAEIDRRAGRTAAAEAASRAAIDFAEVSGLADNAECTVAYLTLGNVLLDSGRFEEAAEAINRGTELAGRIRYVARETAAAAANQRLRSHPEPRRDRARRTTHRPRALGAATAPHVAHPP